MGAPAISDSFSLRANSSRNALIRVAGVCQPRPGHLGLPPGDRLRVLGLTSLLLRPEGISGTKSLGLLHSSAPANGYFVLAKKP